MASDTAQPSSTRSAVLRASILALVLLSAFAAARWTPLADLLERDALVERLEAYRESPWTSTLLVGLLVVFAVVGLPVSPLMFAGAALFGPIGGWLYSLLGCVIGSAVSYGAGRWLGGDLIRKLVGEERIEAMTRIWDRHGFWTIFRLRFLPIPFPFVNYGAALAGIPFWTYFVASALGMAFSVGVWNYLFVTLFEATSGEYRGILVKGALALGGVLAMSFLPGFVRRRQETAKPSVE